VVEAYWLGTSLLAGVSAAPLHDSLRARFAPRLSPHLLNLVLGKVPVGAQPCHAFHVLEVCRRTGALAEQVDVLDNCRISWGQVQTVAKEGLWVNVQPLHFINGQLALAPSQLRFVQHLWDGYGFMANVKPGDWISIHWGWACDRLTSQQVQSLSQSTRHHLALANQTL
jgi:hypothetical protein